MVEKHARKSAIFCLQLPSYSRSNEYTTQCSHHLITFFFSKMAQKCPSARTSFACMLQSPCVCTFNNPSKRAATGGRKLTAALLFPSWRVLRPTTTWFLITSSCHLRDGWNATYPSRVLSLLCFLCCVLFRLHTPTGKRHKCIIRSSNVSLDFCYSLPQFSAHIDMHAD